MPINGFVKTIRRMFNSVVVHLTGDRELSSTIQDASIVLMIRVGGAALIYCTHILLARWLGAFEFGIYAYVWVWVLTLGYLAPVGMNAAVVKYIPEYLTKNNRLQAAGIVRMSLSTVAVTGVLLAVIAVLATMLVKPMLEGYYVIPLYIAFMTVPVFALLDLNEGLARSFGWLKLAYAPSYIIRPALMILLVGTVVALGIETTGITAITAAFVSSLLIFSGQHVILKNRIKGKIRGNIRSDQWQFWLRAAFPFFLIETFYLILANTDIILLGLFMKPQDVAIYYAGVRTAGVLSFVYFAVSAIAAPKFSRYYAGDQHDDLRVFFAAMVRWTFWPSLSAGVLMLLFGKPVLALFGPGFAAGYTVLAILIAGILFKAAAGPVDFLLHMTGNQKMAAFILGLCAVVNIVLNIILIPILGLTGAALATSSSVVIGVIYLGLSARQRLGFAFPVAYLYR